jgi:transposase-like protein
VVVTPSGSVWPVPARRHPRFSCVPPFGRTVDTWRQEVFEQPDKRSAREQLDRVVDGLRPCFGAVAEPFTEAEPDLLTHFAFSDGHRRQIRSTDPLEGLNKEIKRRTAVVGIFPNRGASSDSSG